MGDLGRLPGMFWTDIVRSGVLKWHGCVGLLQHELIPGLFLSLSLFLFNLIMCVSHV